MRSPRTVLLILVFLGFPVFTAEGQLMAQSKGSKAKPNADSLTVQKTAEQFIEAFTNLEWGRFTSFFAPDATAFFPPSAQFPRRANDKVEIEAVFRNCFETAQKQRSNPLYLIIQPKEMKVQVLGDVAIVTFHLED